MWSKGTLRVVYSLLTIALMLAAIPALVDILSKEVVKMVECEVVLSDSIVDKDEGFSADVWIDPGGLELMGYQFTIVYDPTVMQVNEVVFGNIWGNLGHYDMVFGGIDNENGKVEDITSAIAQEGGGYVLTRGLAFTLECSAVGYGVSEIDASEIVVGNDEGGLPADFLAKTLTVARPMDINLDGAVDLSDMQLVASKLGSSGGREDINGDGKVDVLDLILVGQNFGESA